MNKRKIYGVILTVLGAGVACLGTFTLGKWYGQYELYQKIVGCLEKEKEVIENFEEETNE